jgi:hypothetical protein
MRWRWWAMRCLWAVSSHSAGGIASTFIARYFPPTTNPSVTHTISADALYFFPPTGVSIFFTGVSGTGTCTVQRFDAPASNISFTGTPPTFTSQYRFVITASDFTFTSAELRFNRTQIPNAGITNAGTVSVYRRPTPAQAHSVSCPMPLIPVSLTKCERPRRHLASSSWEVMTTHCPLS